MRARTITVVVNEGFADWLRDRMRRRRISTPSELGKLAGIDQSLISRWLRDGTQPTVPALRRIAPVLGVPMLELLVQAGHLEADEVDMNRLPEPHEPEPADVLAAIEADPNLLPEAKAHLRNQYGLLLRLPHLSGVTDTHSDDSSDGPGLAAVARRRRGSGGGRRRT